MQIPSVQELASRARDRSKYQGITMVDAIRSVAIDYGVPSTIIAQELSKRSVSIKKLKKLAKLLSEEKEHIDELADAQQEELLRGAYRHEAEMRGPFATTGHLDDY